MRKTVVRLLKSRCLNMQKDPVSRRAMLRRAGLLLGGAGALSCMRGNSGAANAGALLTDGKTPPLSVAALTALDDALGGKKGSYIENEGVYSTALPQCRFGRSLTCGPGEPAVFIKVGMDVLNGNRRLVDKDAHR